MYLASHDRNSSRLIDVFHSYQPPFQTRISHFTWTSTTYSWAQPALVLRGVTFISLVTSPIHLVTSYGDHGNLISKLDTAKDGSVLPMSPTIHTSVSDATLHLSVQCEGPQKYSNCSSCFLCQHLVWQKVSIENRFHCKSTPS